MRHIYDHDPRKSVSLKTVSGMIRRVELVAGSRMRVKLVVDSVTASFMEIYKTTECVFRFQFLI